MLAKPGKPRGAPDPGPGRRDQRGEVPGGPGGDRAHHVQVGVRGGGGGGGGGGDEGVQS